MRVSLADPTTRTLDSTPAVAGGASTPANDRVSPFTELLRGLGRDISRGEETMRTAVQSVGGGVDLGPGRLLALQAGIYRYSEAIDLASRLVDRATAGVKTIVQGGGQ